VSERFIRLSILAVVALGVVTVVVLVVLRLQNTSSVSKGRGAAAPAPVQLAPITVGSIAERRHFSGALTPAAEFVVAAKISGRLQEMLVELGQSVKRGAVVARLDDDEYAQAVIEAEALVAVAQARLGEVTSAVGAAERTHARLVSLAGRAMATEAALDQAEADMLARRAAVAVAEAQIRQAEAELAGARIRLGYCTVTAEWSEGDAERVVGERFADPGATITANQPLATVLSVHPLTAVIHVTEAVYRRLAVGQPATLRTDAWPDEEFPATVRRISPRFAAASRQAVVELRVDNPDHRLKPGMFIRATIVLADEAAVTQVPAMALTRRGGADVVFVVADGGDTVRQVPVRVGIRDGDLVQVSGDALVGSVVTLGQQLIADGSRIVVPDAPPPAVQDEPAP